MNNDPVAMLRIFFAIPKDEIDRDIATAEAVQLGLLTDRSGLCQNDPDPVLAAKYHHRIMVQAPLHWRQKNVSDEWRLYSAVYGVIPIVQEAICAAEKQGRFGELSRRLKEIEAREGLKWNESWGPGEGPVDYQQIVKEYDELYNGIAATVFAAVLCRYQLEDLAGILEDDSERFSQMMNRALDAIPGPALP